MYREKKINSIYLDVLNSELHSDLFYTPHLFRPYLYDWLVVTASTWQSVLELNKLLQVQAIGLWTSSKMHDYIQHSH